MTPKQHTVRAAIFLGAGVACAIVPAVGMYFDKTRHLALLWLALFFATFPAVGWGASHLAQSRGYPSGGGCGLCVVGYIVSAFVGSTSPHPLALGVGILFIVLLPTVVLLALPNKAERSHHRRRRRHH
jgi:hypothetical protein